MLAIIFFVTLFSQVGALLVDSYALFLVLVAITSLLRAFYIGPTHAAVQSLVDPSARSFASAVTVFCINCIRIAFGGFLFRLISEALSPSMCSEPIRWALLLLSICQLWYAGSV